MLCLRSEEFQNSARAFSVHHVCRFWIRAFWKLWVCWEVSALGWTAQPLPGKGAALLTLSFLRDFRSDLGVMVRIPALIFIEPAGWCIGKHLAASLFVTFLAAVKYWNKKWTFGLADLQLVLYSQALLLWLTGGASFAPRTALQTSSPNKQLHLWGSASIALED